MIRGEWRCLWNTAAERKSERGTCLTLVLYIYYYIRRAEYDRWVQKFHGGVTNSSETAVYPPSFLATPDNIRYSSFFSWRMTLDIPDRLEFTSVATFHLTLFTVSKLFHLSLPPSPLSLALYLFLFDTYFFMTYTFYLPTITSLSTSISL